MLPERNRKCRTRQGRGWLGIRLPLGIGCILLGLLILLLCAPDWLIGLIVSMLLFCLGFYLVGF